MTIITFPNTPTTSLRKEEVSCENNSLNIDENNVIDGGSGETWNWNGYNIHGLGNYTYLNNNLTRVVIRLKDGPKNEYQKLMSIVDETKASIVNTISMNGKIAAVVAEILPKKVNFFVKDLQKMDSVEYIEPNIEFQTTFVPDDEYWDRQWNLQKIEADWAWNTTMGSSSVLVAVVDTGIDYNHPDLAANYVPLGYDWMNNDTDPIDDSGHGTHCAGIIAAVTNNSIGIAGLAQVRIMAEKGFDSEGRGYTDTVAQGIINAVDKGANIISMSWGAYGTPPQLLYEAIKYAYDSGVLLVAAAGNYPSSMRHYPAAYDEVVAVGATDRNDIWYFPFGEWLEIFAPGMGIYSTISESHDPSWTYPYDTLSGTSMACPHVVGVAALILTRFPDLKRDRLRVRLWYSTDDLGDPGFDIHYGYGRINAKKAVEEAFPEHDLIITGWKRQPYLEPGGNGTISVTIFNFGKNNEEAIDVQLLANGSLVDSVTVNSLAMLKSVTVNLSWTPAIEGMYNITAFVVPTTGESQLFSNAVWFHIYVGFPTKAVVLDSQGTDTPVFDNWNNLNKNWQRYGNKFIYIDYTTLNKENITYNDLVASDADVLIIACGWEFTDSEIEAIKKYTYEEHGLIATSGTFHFVRPINNKLAPLFGLSESTYWEIARAKVHALELIRPDHPLFFNIPNPFGFHAMDACIPADRKWKWNENAGGSYVALGWEMYQTTLDAAIVTYKGLVYISPFIEGIIFLDDDFEENLQLFYNAITWSRYQKQGHDLSTFLECPSHLKPGETASLNITVSNMGSNDETDIELCLTVNETIIENVTIAKLHTNSSFNFGHNWIVPNVEATHNISVYVHPVLNENYTEDNLNVKILRVTNTPVIGIIKTHWETLYSQSLPDYCKKLGYVVEKIFENLTLSLLDKCDVIVIGEDWRDTPWPSTEIEAVQAYIDSGKGFLAIGDLLSTQVQEILENYGISYAGTRALTGYTTNFDSIHPIMDYVDEVFVRSWIPWAEVTYNSLKVVSPAYWIVNDTSNEHIVVAGAEVNGHVLCLSGNFAKNIWTNAQMFKNILEWMTFQTDIVITDVITSTNRIVQGSTLYVNVTVTNQGVFNENFNITTYYNSEIIETQSVYLDSESSKILTFTWDTTNVAKGDYTILAKISEIQGKTNLGDNGKAADSIVTVLSPGHDVAIKGVKPFKTVVAQGYSVSIAVTTKNYGDFSEAFNVTAYANVTIIETREITLASGNSTTIILTWNTSGIARGNYTITAEATPVPEETDTLDNKFKDGWIAIAILGDINADGKVNIKDIAPVARAYGANEITDPEDPRYGEYWHDPPCNYCPHDPILDLDGNGEIKMKDVATVAKEFGKTA